MSNRIEWIDADAVQDIEQSFIPGYFSDGFGTVNAGTAIAFAGVVIEGSIDELEDFVVRMQQAIDDMAEEIRQIEEE